VVSTDSFEIRLMSTSKMVTVRFGMTGRVGHDPPSLPRGPLGDRPPRGRPVGFRPTSVNATVPADGGSLRNLRSAHWSGPPSATTQTFV
jgi:hypothetical protein